MKKDSLNSLRLVLAASITFSILAGCSHSQPHSESPSKSESTWVPTARPLVIGHRGSPGTFPDHTLEGYREAIKQGADIIEPDLVMTKDGVLICRHENDLSQTTNVSQVFPLRKTTKIIDGKSVAGWFSEDFTLKEVNKLRARQPLPFREQKHNDLYLIPTFDHVLQLVKQESAKAGRAIGVYPETKHPSYFQKIQLSLEEPLLLALKRADFQNSAHPVFIQSFEISNLKQLKSSKNFSPKYKLVQLLDDLNERPYDQVLLKLPTTYADMITDAGLATIAQYAQGIGPWKRMIRAEAPDKKLLQANNLVDRAHEAGLLVHPYTFRNDPLFLSAAYRENPLSEYFDFFDLGVDGVFSDFPHTASEARDQWVEEKRVQQSHAP